MSVVRSTQGKLLFLPTFFSGINRHFTPALTPNEYFGESVKAYVSLKPEMDGDPEEIIKFCRVYLAGYKAPHQVQILDDLPKTGNGKILKRLIREQYESKSGD